MPNKLLEWEQFAGIWTASSLINFHWTIQLFASAGMIMSLKSVFKCPCIIVKYVVDVLVDGVYRLSWNISIKCVFLWMKVSRLVLWVQQVTVSPSTSMCRFVACRTVQILTIVLWLWRLLPESVEWYCYKKLTRYKSVKCWTQNSIWSNMLHLNKNQE